MSDKPATQPPDAAEPAASGGGSMKSLVLICLIAAIAGGGAGAVVLGPKLGAKSAATADDGNGGDEEGHGSEEEGSHGAILTIGNLIINPAGSQGTRFLMVTVGISVQPEALLTGLRENELAVRDAIGSLLESKTLTELTQLGARDTIRVALAEKIKPLAGAGAKVRIYLPQYVIQ